jgi:hypothetical protein
MLSTTRIVHTFSKTPIVALEIRLSFSGLIDGELARRIATGN